MSKQSAPIDEELVHLRSILKAILDKRITYLNLEICEKTLQYGQILTSVNLDVRSKMYKKFLDCLEECRRLLRELFNRIQTFKQASHPYESLKDREVELMLLRAMVKVYLKNPITRFNLGICQKIFKHGMKVTAFPTDLRDSMNKRAQECFDECDRQLKDLADRIDMYGQENQHSNEPSSSRDKVPRTINYNHDEPLYTKRLKTLKDALVASRTVEMDEDQNYAQLLAYGEELLGAYEIRPNWTDNLKSLYAGLENEMNWHKARFIQTLDKHSANQYASATHPTVGKQHLDEHPTLVHHSEVTTQPNAADKRLKKHRAQERKPVETDYQIIANPSRKVHYDQEQHMITTGLSVGHLPRHLKYLNKFEEERQPVEATHPKVEEELKVEQQPKKRRVGTVTYHVEKEDVEVITID